MNCEAHSYNDKLDIIAFADVLIVIIIESNLTYIYCECVGVLTLKFQGINR